MPALRSVITRDIVGEEGGRGATEGGEKVVEVLMRGEGKGGCTLGKITNEVEDLGDAHVN